MERLLTQGPGDRIADRWQREHAEDRGAGGEHGQRRLLEDTDVAGAPFLLVEMALDHLALGVTSGAPQHDQDLARVRGRHRAGREPDGVERR